MNLFARCYNIADFKPILRLTRIIQEKPVAFKGVIVFRKAYVFCDKMLGYLKFVITELGNHFPIKGIIFKGIKFIQPIHKYSVYICYNKEKYLPSIKPKSYKIYRIIAVISMISIACGCTSTAEYMEGDNICYDKCLQQGLYVLVDTKEQCICARGIE